MRFTSKRIAALSRDPRFQFKSVVVILLSGIAVAFGISLSRDGTVGDRSRGIPFILRYDAQPPVSSRADCVQLLDKVRNDRLFRQRFRQLEGSRKDKAPESRKDFGVASRFLSQQEHTLLLDYAVKMMPDVTVGGNDLAPFAAAAVVEPPSGFIASMYGDLLRLTGEYDDALTAYERGAADAETGADCSRRALDLCLRRNWKDKLHRLYRLPGWREAIVESDATGAIDVRRIAAAAGDWTGLLTISWLDLRESLRHPQWVLVSLLCGALWFLVIHVGACIAVRHWWRGVLGFALGVMSIPLTLFFITVQETWFDYREADAGTGDLFYCISGIGFREELAKLILFLPLLIVLRKALPAQVLAAAACVGLGFAIEENVNYFAGNPAVYARFLTANFGHFAMTGLTGLALWQAVRNTTKLQHFTVVFIGAVVFHGLWDWSPPDPRFAGDFSFLMFGGFVGLSYYFFGELLRYGQPQPGVPSAVFIFLAGGAVMLSVLLSISTWQVGFRLALATTFPPVLMLFAIGAAMYYQLRRA